MQKLNRNANSLNHSRNHYHSSSHLRRRRTFVFSPVGPNPAKLKPKFQTWLSRAWPTPTRSTHLVGAGHAREIFLIVLFKIFPVRDYTRFFKIKCQAHLILVTHPCVTIRRDMSRYVTIFCTSCKSLILIDHSCLVPSYFRC